MLSASIVAFALMNSVVAKDCPSKLPSHVVQATDWLEVGAELRSMTVGMVPGDALSSPPPDDDFDLAELAGVKLLAYAYPTDSLTLVLEPEIRYKHPGWEDEAIPGLWPLRFNQALAEYDFGKAKVTAGIQNIAWGTGAILDARLIGMSVDYSSKAFAVGLFGAVAKDSMLRNSDVCLWRRYAGGKGWWRHVTDTPSENRVAGASFSLKLLKPWKIKGLVYVASLTGDTPGGEGGRGDLEPEDLSGTFASMNVTAPIVSRRASFSLEPLLSVQGDETRVATVGLLRLTPFDGRHSPRGRFGVAATFTDGFVAPAMEGLSWGYLRRYSVHDGQLGTFRMKWPLSDEVDLRLDYQIALADDWSDALGDELDAGVELAPWDERYRVTFAFAALDLAGPLESSLGGYVELRLIAGAK